MLKEGDLLWTPSAERASGSNVALFMDWLREQRGLDFDGDYNRLWRWSVEELEDFWQAIWDYFEVESSTPYECVLRERVMPGAEWFPGARLNFARYMLRKARPGKTVLYHLSETTALGEVTWDELESRVKVMAQHLRRLGIEPGDRVVSLMPNIPETLIAFLAAVSLGAIWSSSSPDFGSRSVVDRFSQIGPKLLFAADGYTYGGKAFDRRAAVTDLIESLPSLEQVVFLPYLDKGNAVLPATGPGVAVCPWDELEDASTVAAEDFVYEDVAFDHPLWVVYSSGTTGLPKPIVHGHGGITLEMLKLMHFHIGLGPDSVNFFFTTTGWVMWNITIASLVSGGAAVLYDGNPAYPEPDVLWKMGADAGATTFGASPTYVQIMEQQGIVPNERFDVSRMETILMSGSPVTPETMQWCYEKVNADMWVTSQSGGTDIASGFVGASPTLPVYAGEIQTRMLGADVHAFNDEGEPVIDEVGELVCCQPMPSMPLYFWNDSDKRRYRESYFEYFPGVWRHGDFLKVNQRGGCYIYGRSDSTLNRYGVRIGTAEIYRAVEKLGPVRDSLIVNLDLPDARFFMPLFVVLEEDVELDEALRKEICTQLRESCSPRHVPDEIYQIAAVPYTLTGKKMEVPVRRILMGVAPEQAANRDAMADPGAIDYFIEFARQAG